MCLGILSHSAPALCTFLDIWNRLEDLDQGVGSLEQVYLDSQYFLELGANLPSVIHSVPASFSIKEFKDKLEDQITIPRKSSIQPY